MASLFQRWEGPRSNIVKTSGLGCKKRREKWELFCLLLRLVFAVVVFFFPFTPSISVRWGTTAASELAIARPDSSPALSGSSPRSAVVRAARKPRYS